MGLIGEFKLDLSITSDEEHIKKLFELALESNSAVHILLVGPVLGSLVYLTVENAVAFHTTSGQKFTVTYSVDATANSPTKTK